VIPPKAESGRPDGKSPSGAFARSNAREAGRGRSLKLAAFAAFAGPQDLLTPSAPQLTDARLRGHDKEMLVLGELPEVRDIGETGEDIAIVIHRHALNRIVFAPGNEADHLAVADMAPTDAVPETRIVL